MFGRKRSRAADGGDAEGTQPKSEPGADAETPDDGSAEPAPPPRFDRGAGPFDADEVEDTSGLADFGALLVPAVQGISLRLEADPKSGQVIAMTLVHGTAAVQLRALAAPRSGGLWRTNREAMANQIRSTGGRAAEQSGPFGVELHAAVPIPEGQPGGPGLRPMRFVGVEGPRWLLHGAFMGQGADPSAWDAINDVFRGLVVVRGPEAMPAGSLLRLHPPENAQPTGSAAGAAPTLDSLEPGDRITEVR